MGTQENGLIETVLLRILKLMFKLMKSFYLTIYLVGNFSLFFLLFADFFSKSNFSKNSSRNIIKVSNSLDPDQDRWNFDLIWVQTVCKGNRQTTLIMGTIPIKT